MPALAGLAWLAGVALQLQQPLLAPPPWRWAAGAVALGLLAAAGWRRMRGVAVRGGVVLAALLLGWSSTEWRAAARLADSLPAALEGQDVVAIGDVVGLPAAGAAGTRFVFAIDSATHRGQPVALPRLASVGWYHAGDGDAAAPPLPLRAGQRWQLTLRLKAPHGTLNPQGFDVELWLFERGLRASASVRSAPPPRLLDAAGCCPLQRARQAIRDGIERQVADRTLAGVLSALVVGDQAAIDRDDWELFRATGVAHLMSISGLHVTMFAWLAGGLVARLWRCSPRLLDALPLPLAARWGGLAAAAGYALLAGFGVPAQRTLWMLATLVLLRSIGWRWPAPRVLLAAAWVVVIADPWALLQPGFWLSFAAVALLIASDPAWQPAPRAVTADADGAPAAPSWRERTIALLRGALRTQFVASVGLAPLSLLFFQQLSLVGFAANLLAIPLVTLLITPLALAGVLLPWCWSAAAALTQALLAALGAFAGWPGAVWSAAAAPAWAAAAGLLGGVLLALPLPARARLAGLPLLVPLLLPPADAPPHGRFDVIAADVGQGTAVLVRTREQLLLYDAGPSYSPDADAGHRVLLPLLRARGERRITLLMLSHRDSDHTGGAASLLARLPVAALSSSLEAGHPLLANGIDHRRCAAGQRWQWDGVTFAVLHPPPGAAAGRPNTLSCVLKVMAADGSALLLTGDIEAAQEAALVATDAAALRADVLLVPHHGSRTSSTPAFVDAVAPAVALVQAGYRSRFGHPAPDVVQRYAARGINVVRSDRCGAWQWRSGGPASGVCERRAMARYWHHRPHEPEEPRWPSTSR